MAKPKSMSDVRSRFTKVIEANVTAAKNVENALKNKGHMAQHAVDKNGWDGDVFNLKDMGLPWATTEHGDDVVMAIKDADAPGVVGDLMASVTQGDWLATQERAFRQRHSSKIRNSMHAAGRRYGHGHPSGLFAKGVVNYVKQIVKMSKDSRG